MMNNSKFSLSHSLPIFLKEFLVERKIGAEYKKWLKPEIHLSKMWELNNNYVPVPNFVKERTIRETAKKYSTKIFVETGTYLGAMVEALKDDFEIIISIELSKNLAERAKKKFKSLQHIEIIQGDSGEKIDMVLAKLKKPALFWLDGHYSGGITAKAEIETPVFNEVQSILNDSEKGHVILIDDARLFNGTRDYPTHEELKKFISRYSINFTYEVTNDIIKIIHN